PARERALADARVPDHGDERGATVLGDAAIARAQELDLAVPADEDRLEPPDTPAPRQGESAYERTALDPVRESLCLHDPRRTELEGSSRGVSGSGVDEDVLRAGRLLEPRAEVDDRTGHERAVLA